MEEKVDLARAFCKNISKVDFRKEWDSVAETLNSLGLPNRDGVGWQKVWNDLKFKVKKKLLQNKNEVKAMGGGVYKQQQLSPLEKTVANLLNFAKVISPQGNSLGFVLIESNTCDRSSTVAVNLEPLPSTSGALFNDEPEEASTLMPTECDATEANGGDDLVVMDWNRPRRGKTSEPKPQKVISS